MSINPVKSAPVRIQKKPRQLNLSTLISQGFVENCGRGAVTAPSLLSHAIQNVVNNNLESGSTTPTSSEDTSLLATIGGSSELLKVLESLESSINNGNYDCTLIHDVCNYLKANGSCLDDGPFKEQIDLYFNTLRNISRDNRLDPLSRARLLEVIELRALNWLATDEMTAFFDKKYSELETNANILQMSNQTALLDLSTSASASGFSANNSLPPNYLAPSEVIKGSGKFSKPAKVPGKNFVKDEFVIRNSDSGKVNTGAKERLLQITGPNEESINRAKYLIEDTIKRNASPIPPENQALQSCQYSSSNLQPLTPASSHSNLTRSTSNVDNVFGAITAAASSLPFVQAIAVDSEVIIISSSCGKLSETAKTVLEQYFDGCWNGSKKWQNLENGKNLGYEASESSDSDVLVSNKESQSIAVINREVDLQASVRSVGHKTPLGYQLSRQTSFHSTQASIESSTNLNDDKALQRSASQGSFPPGRTSLRYLNVDFEFDKNATEGNAAVSDGKVNLIAYDRDFLLDCRNSQLSVCPPHNFDEMLDKFPDIVRYSPGVEFG